MNDAVISLENMRSIQRHMFAQQGVEIFAVGRYIQHQAYYYVERHAEATVDHLRLMLLAEGKQYWIIADAGVIEVFIDASASYFQHPIESQEDLGQLRAHLEDWLRYTTGDQDWPPYQEFCFKQRALTEIKTFADLAYAGLNHQETKHEFERLATQLFSAPSTYAWSETRLSINTTYVMGDGNALSDQAANVREAYLSPEKQVSEFVKLLINYNLAVVIDLFEASYKSVFNSFYSTLILTRQQPIDYRFGHGRDPHDVYGCIYDVAEDLDPLGLTLLKLEYEGEEVVVLPIEIGNREALKASGEKLGIQLLDIEIEHQPSPNPET